MSKLEKIRDFTTDVLVIGGGIAAAFAAIRAKQSGHNVLLADKGFFGRSGCSALASGMYKTFMPGDSLENWGADKTGPLVNLPFYRKAIPLTYELLTEMDRCGVKFIREKGQITRMTSTGGSALAAMLAEGGPQMMMALRGHVLAQGVHVLSRMMVTDLLTTGETDSRGCRVAGAVGFHTRTGEIIVIRARTVVVCTGPYSFPYLRAGASLGYMPIDLTGDGHSAMLRAGVVMSRLDRIGPSIHTSELYCAPGLELMLGGLGARFFNGRGERFMERYFPVKKEAVNRHLLAMAIAKEIREGRHPVFIDVTHLSPEQLHLCKAVIPIIMLSFERAGYDPATDRIPYTVCSAATHGVAGCGAKIGWECETSLTGLYAAGGCSDGNFLPAVDLSFSAVTGAWAGLAAGRYAKDAELPDVKPSLVRDRVAWMTAPLLSRGGLTFEQIHKELADTVTNHIGVVLDGVRLEKALKRLEELSERVQSVIAKTPHELVKINGLRNYLFLLHAIVLAYSWRKESRTPVIREDYPATDNDRWLKLVFVRLREGRQFQIWDEPVPESFHETNPERGKTLHPVFQQLRWLES